jgi:hypothetical protein
VSRLAQENIVAGLLLVVFGGVVWLCQDFGPRARMIPLPLAIFGIVLTLIQIVWQNVRSTDELQMDLISVDVAATSGAAPPSRAVEGAASRHGELRAFGVVVLLLALVFVVGLIPAVFLFTGGYFVLTRQYSWVMGLVYTALFTASVYLLFIAALQIEPYHGWLAPLVERFR